MRVELALIARRQGGLVKRAQAHHVGYTERELRTLTAPHGPWVIVRRGIYADRAVVNAASESDDGLAKLQDRAASLAMVHTHVMSHDSAARIWGLPLLEPKKPLIHVTREGVIGTRTDAGVKHHLTQPGLVEGYVVDGLPVTNLARTSLDISREHGIEAGAIAVDAARRRGVDLSVLAREVSVMKHWPNVTSARASIEASDPGAESPGETLLRLALREADLGEIGTQFPLRLGSQVAWVDLRIGRHVFEFDGRVKFRRFEDGGAARGSIEDALWAERTRQNEICELGLGVSRVTWDELLGRRRSETIARLTREFRLTVDRYGSTLPQHLLAFAEQMVGERDARLSARLPRAS
jgi:hypothetical protein